MKCKNRRVCARARSSAGVLVRLALACGLVGCGMSREDQLKAVAKDWCMTIRASQVIPVYPLTEDIQPGDLYLVQTTVDKQQEVYRKRGFLPLDNLIARLDPSGYPEFYDHSFLPDRSAAPTLPATWVRPGGDIDPWGPAPNAAFPSYSFSVQQGAGLSLAVPISGIPVGLSLLGAQTANGSVSIQRARTLGVDTVSLYGDLQAWAEVNRSFLKVYGPNSADQAGHNFVRAITRVYSTGKVDIALSDSRSFSGGADVGVPRPIDLVSARPPSGQGDVSAATIDNYKRSLSSLNAMLAETYSPTRGSGSNEGLDPAATDAKTKAKREALEAERKQKTEAVQKAQEELAAETPKGNAARAEIARAERTVAEKERALQEADTDEAKENAAAELESANQALSDAKEKAQPALDKEAAAQGRSEIANAALADIAMIAPGGSLRVTAASSRFISLQQDFDPPLVIGYLAFDCEIRKGGVLGPPIPTHARIDPAAQGTPYESADVIKALYSNGLDVVAYSELKEAAASDDQAADAVARLDRLGLRVPTNLEVFEEADDGSLHAIQEVYSNNDYRDFLSYWAALRANNRVISERLERRQTISLKRPSGTESVAPGSPAWLELASRQGEWSTLLADPLIQRLHADAATFAGQQYLERLMGRRELEKR